MSAREFMIPGYAQRVPNSKPYIERKFGTAERDFVEWLKGATGPNVKEKGPKVPQIEACVTFEDFVMLYHQYQIECFARRPQESLGWRTPEQVWMHDTIAIHSYASIISSARTEMDWLVASLATASTARTESDNAPCT